MSLDLSVRSQVRKRSGIVYGGFETAVKRRKFGRSVERARSSAISRLCKMVVVLRHAVLNTVAIGLLVVGAALAQTEDQLNATVGSIRYPPLAEHARIDGDVHIKVQAGVVTLISGHPLLAPVAIESAKSLASLDSRTSFDVTYHFILADAASLLTSTTVKRGNALERAVLRVFGFKTEKVVQSYQCESVIAPATQFKRDGARIEVWIYGRALCLEPDTATRVASR